MRVCRQCGVKLKNDIPQCPLCDMDTEVIDHDFAEDYPYIKSRFTKGLLLRLITFISIMMVAASFLVDHLTPTTGSPWPFITTAAIVYGWVSAMNILRNTPNPASITLCQLFCASGLLFFIDYWCGWKRWSVNYVIPFLIMGAAVAMTMMIVIRPMKNRKYTIYQLVIAVLGVASVLLWIFGYSEVEWPVVTAAWVSMSCFVTMLVFSHRKTKNELHKRFHV